MKNQTLLYTLSASLIFNSLPAWSQVTNPGTEQIVVAPIVQTPMQIALEQNSFGLAASQLTMLKKFYASFSFNPIWYRDQRLLSSARQLKSAVQKVEMHGFKATDYWNDSHDSILNNSVMSESEMLKNDLTLSMIYIQIGMQLNIGRVNPLKVAADIKYKQKAFTKYDVLVQGLRGDGISSAWDRLAPSHQGYRRLMGALARLKESEVSVASASITKSKTTLKVGSKAPVVLEIKKRLQLLGHNIEVVDDNYDENLASVIKDIQRSNLVDATGRLTAADTGSWEYFQVGVARRIQQIELTMEKWRWLPETLGSRYLFLNLAVQEIEMIDPELSQDSVLVKQKTINGRVDRKTPSMMDKVTHVVLNPTWTVPSGILEKDKLPAIREHFAKGGMQAVLGYFAHMRFGIFSKETGAMMDPTTVDWPSITAANATFYLRQSAGYENALGIAKFNLGNPYDIYLHDTNERNLFSKSYRLKSSGCVRVQYPVDMAEYFLKTGAGWDREQIESYIATDTRVGGETKWFGIPKDRQMPIYILSLTARADAKGVVRFTQDFYKQNAALLKALEKAGYYKVVPAPVSATPTASNLP